jgi:hypothetical protein
MCYAQLGELLNDTEKVDPLTPKLVKGIMKQDSKLVEGAANKMNWWQLAQKAQQNQDKPEQGVAEAAVATGMGFLGPMLGGGAAAGGAAGTAANAAPAAMTAAEMAAMTAAEQAAAITAQEAAMQAAQQGLLANAPQGFANTMEAGLMGPTSHVTDAAMRMSTGPGPGVAAPGKGLLGQMDSYLINNDMSQYAGRLGNQSKQGRFAVKQGLGMMQEPQQQTPQAPPPRPYQEQQAQMPYGMQNQEIPEELKRKLRAMGYPI